ncbi:MAG: hypothetical protein IBJ11_01425 [Phycisphaerales bacterium]|nr:hypothetical protein [Phycisphaerales bacterium]
MIVLAVHDGHDSGACILRDGRVVLCSSEERRLNKKNFAGVPMHSINACFERTGIDPKDVDLVAIVGTIRNTPPTREQKKVFGVLQFISALGRSHLATDIGRWIMSRMARRQQLFEFLAQRGLAHKPVRCYDHHECHAATAHWHRPWSDRSLVLTIDGAGDGLCATVSVGEGDTLRRIARTTKYHSIADGLYSGITQHLGLRPYEHEYKVMGMAPYGQAEYVAPTLRRLFSVEGLEFRNHTGRFGARLKAMYPELLRFQRFDNISAGCQLVFEELMVKWVRNAIAATGVHKVCGAGGAFLNVKANKLIRELPEVQAFYAYPASDDGGCPVGAAVLGYLDVCRERGVEPRWDLPRTMYLGLQFSESECEKAARASGLPFERMADPARAVGGLIAEGQIVGRFAGAEEVGPRSLGNRAILADPRDMKVIRKLNFAIKQRDFWMPFAASILEEDAPRYIRNCSPWAFYMIEAFDTNPAALQEIIAGTHPMDETVRPQIVNELNPEYRDVIRAFKQITGVGAVLNTSFNLHGSPIVGTPEIAIHTLVNSDMDAVALGPFLVRKPAGHERGSDAGRKAVQALERSYTKS